MFYPAQLIPEDGGFVVRFRDIPEALTCGDDLTHAQAMAADALLTAFEFYFEDKRPVPLPSALEAGEVWVSVPASVFAKVLLLNEMLAQNITQAELARRMQTKPQEVQRWVNLQHATKIDTLAQALLQLGKHLHWSLV